MKIWKKTLALILGLTTFASLTACGEGEDFSSSDSSYSSEDSSYSPELKNQIAEQVINSIVQQVSQAKTISLSASGTYKLNTETWEEQTRNNITKETFSAEVVGEIDAVLSQTFNGSYNAKIEVSYLWKTDETQEFRTNIASMYLINGYLFTSLDEVHFEKDPLLSKDSIDTIEEVTLIVEEALGMVLEDVQLPSIDTDALFSALVGLATETFSFSATSLTLEYDFAPAIQAVQSFVAKINPKQTLGHLLNDILGMIDESLTVESILDVVESLANVNARTALTEIDAWLTKNYQTTLQGVWDTVTDSQKFVELFTYIAEESGMLPANIIEYIENIQAWELETLLSYVEDFEVMTLYDLFVEAISQYGSEMPTFNDFRTILEDYLDTRLEYFIPPALLDTISGASVDTLTNATTLTFDSSYTLTEFSNDLVCDFSANLPSEYEGLTDTYKVYADLQQAYTLSSVAFPIALPNGAIIYDD